MKVVLDDFITGRYRGVFINLCVLLFAVGIIIGVNYGDEKYIIPLGIAAIIVAVCSIVLMYKQSRLAIAVVALLFFISGNLRSDFAMYLPAEDISNWHGREVTVTGTLEGEPRVTEDSQGIIHLRYILKADTLVEWKEKNAVGGKVVVYSKGADKKEDWQEYGRSGDRLTVSGKLRFPHDYQNPGRMDVVKSQRAQGITAQLLANRNSIKLDNQDGDWLLRRSGEIRQYYRQRMEAVMPKTDAAAIFAMLFGGYEGIKEDLLEAFTLTGIVHILSVSGSHITLLAGTAGLLGKLLRISDKMIVAFTTLIILLYGTVAGAIPPVIRSAAMGIITLFAMMYGKEKDACYVLGFIALCMLLHSPLLLYDISFQLSFGATAGLLYISPVLRRLFRKIKICGRMIPEFVTDSFAITIGAQLSVLPLLAWYFNTISLTSLAANLVVVPVVEWIIIIGLFGGLIACVIPVVGKVFFICGSLLLGGAYELSKQIAQLPGSKLYLPTMEIKAGILYYTGLICCLQTDMREKIIKHKNSVIGLSLVMGVFMIGCQITKTNEMQVHFIDCGQGDSCLVITPHGHAFMVDTGGNRDTSYDVGSRVDVPYLLHYGVTKLDYIFLTHAHDDHAAGVRGIAGKIPVGAVMIGHEGKKAYMDVFGNKNPAIRNELLAPLKENTCMEIDGVKVEILYSPTAEQAVTGGGATGNEFSNLFRISYGNAAFLITGDLVKEQEKVLLEEGKNVGATVLKVGHHGSKTSSSEEFLKAVNPRWCVISCGYDNSYGHPHKETLDKIKTCTNSEIMRTDYQGAIVFKTDGRKITVDKFKA